MKSKITICLLIMAMLSVLNGCGSFSECREMQQKEVLILLDVSDPRLFKEIQEDLMANFGGFMSGTDFGSIDNCQCLNLSVAYLGGREALEMASASISITRKGLSRTEQKELANPAPLVKLIRSKMEEFEKLSQTPEMTEESYIATVVIKSIVHLNHDAESMILVFSDMVENNQTINFYRQIPPAGEISSVTEKMIDPVLLKQFRDRMVEGMDTRIIIVQKPEPADKTQLREVKEFWAAFLKELKLDGQVQFIDNLSNPVEL